MNLMKAARDDQRLATALHEAGHAVAYLSSGRGFQYLSVEEWRLVGNGESIDAWDRAVTSMAGPAVESLIFNHGRGDDAAVHEWITSTLRERMEFAELDDCAEPDDYTDAGPCAAAALPLALAIVTSRWEDIERVAAAAIQFGRLTHSEVRQLATGGVVAAELERWNGAASGQSGG
ncbi:hypothetical protein [Arthrobacter sp. AL12]|uniref:hypothetical protein n=1 Tax=Arthrobacter sp. AL12 TaxID=3042241 RepID=UPI00249B7BDD|nr:hypothetical protein [Arthrobacter sp. AL12]MDI3211688.1 hypothetical protein [Arthrobacter sp. AL12]